MAKIRMGFVANSSSSSYLVVYSVDYGEELKNFIKEEFGNYGVRIADKFIVDKHRVLECMVDEYGCNEDVDTVKLEEDGKYICASRLAWSNDGDKEGADCWLADHIPTEFIKKIYEGEAD